jgi:RNA polymerase sigma-70 factor (ECF subfamily)
MSATDREEFIQQIDQNQGILHKVCGMFCSQIHDREDLYQEIILQLWKSWKNFKGDSKFSTWMYRVALNTAISMSARTKKHQPVKEIQKDQISPSEDDYGQVTEEDIQQLYLAISKLTDIERAVILLYLEEKSYDEIAQITGLSKSNVGVKILRIKKRLEVEMKKGTGYER